MLRSGGAQLLLADFPLGGAAVALPPPPGDTFECASVSHKLCVERGRMLDSATGYVNSSRSGRARSI